MNRWCGVWLQVDRNTRLRVLYEHPPQSGEDLRALKQAVLQVSAVLFLGFHTLDVVEDAGVGPQALGQRSGPLRSGPRCSRCRASETFRPGMRSCASGWSGSWMGSRPSRSIGRMDAADTRSSSGRAVPGMTRTRHPARRSVDPGARARAWSIRGPPAVASRGSAQPRLGPSASRATRFSAPWRLYELAPDRRKSIPGGLDGTAGSRCGVSTFQRLELCGPSGRIGEELSPFRRLPEEAMKAATTTLDGLAVRRPGPTPNAPSTCAWTKGTTSPKSRRRFTSGITLPTSVIAGNASRSTGDIQRAATSSSALEPGPIGSGNSSSALRAHGELSEAGAFCKCCHPLPTIVLG